MPTPKVRWLRERGQHLCGQRWCDLHAAPDAGFLLGITRQFVIDTVAPACQHSVLERTLRLEDLYDADEIFLTGTAAEVIGASKIGDRVIERKSGTNHQKF